MGLTQVIVSRRLFRFLVALPGVILISLAVGCSGGDVGNGPTPTLQTFTNPFDLDLPSCGYKITLRPQLLAVDQVLVDVSVVDVQVDVPDLRITPVTSPALKPVDVPQGAFALFKNQPIHTTFRLLGMPAGKDEVVGVSVLGTTRIGPCGAAAGFWLDSVNGKWQIDSDSQHSRLNPQVPRESASSGHI
jgi:hypothetical protein